MWIPLNSYKLNGWAELSNVQGPGNSLCASGPRLILEISHSKSVLLVQSLTVWRIHLLLSISTATTVLSIVWPLRLLSGPTQSMPLRDSLLHSDQIRSWLYPPIASPSIGTLKWHPIALRIKSKLLKVTCKALRDLAPVTVQTHFVPLSPSLYSTFTGQTL